MPVKVNGRFCVSDCDSESLELREKEVAFNGGIFIAVAAVNGIGINAFGVKVANGARFCFLRVGGSNQLAEIFHSVVFLQNGGVNRTATHK